jgi:eukaryotic-like serine/threonine-protein kinase
MTEPSKQWEGQIVEGIFPLRQYLGGSDHSAVFLTEFAGGDPQKAVIKLIPCDPATADVQLSSWGSAGQLAHPNLLRLFRSGRCRIDGYDLLYLVMEYAEEDLSQILPQRALTPEETRDMLGPLLDALEYLHGRGFVHGDLKPANILATGDRLKLSSDGSSRIGESQSVPGRAGAYDAPEASSGMLTPAADVWSLGMTLVEVLTQHLPEWQPAPNREPLVPVNLPAPFLEIARQCLRPEPLRRIGVAEIAARMNPRALAAAASRSASAPGSNPSVSHIARADQAPPRTPQPAAPLPGPSRGAARMQHNPHRPPSYRESGSRSRFLLPLVIGALLFAAILTVPRLLPHHPDRKSAATVVPDKPASQTAAGKPADSADSSRPERKPERESAVSQTAESAAPAVPPTVRQAAPAVAPDSLKTTSEREQPSRAASSAATAASRETLKPGAPGVASAKGEVLDQVLPDVPQKARGTIHGKVRVSVRVHVDAAGGVSEAEFESPGPSQFFANLALQAARKWAFTPPEVNGKSVTSEWRLRFEFTQKDTKAIPRQTAP